MDPQIQYAKTEDGVSIAYYTMGDGPPILRITWNACYVDGLRDMWNRFA